MQSEQQELQQPLTRLPLFPIDPLDNGTAVATGAATAGNGEESLARFRSITSIPTKRIILLATRALRTLQLNWKAISAGCLVTLLALLWCYPTIFFLLLFLAYSLFLVLAAIGFTIYINYIFNGKEPAKPNFDASRVLQQATQNSIFDQPNPIKSASSLHLIFGKTVDLQLQQIIEYVLRDFMSPWLGHVVTKPKLINDMVREDLWNAIQKIHDRAIKLDAAKIIAVDMVNRITVHLEKIRIADSRSLETANTPVFATNSYLVNEDKEMEFLRKLSEIMIILLLPRGYSLAPLKVLLSELLAFKIFFPLIKNLTAPDYINQKIVQNIESRLAAAAMSKRSYEYAASFDDFLKIINNAGNLEELSLIRKSIVNDLMHATTMQNLQRAKGLDPDTDDHCLTKTEMHAAVRLKRYVQQLSYAKAQCEKNLLKYGWNGNYTSNLDLSLVDILNTAIGRRYFTLFLEPLKASALVGFYVAVEEMKHAPQSACHQLGTEIFYSYVRVPKPEIQIDKNERKLVETFLLGDTGPDIFYNIQKRMLKTLEEKYYAPFLLSEQYRMLKDTLDSNELKDPTLDLATLNDGHDEQANSFNGTDGNGLNTMDVAAHTSYARRRLEQIQERIDKKTQALEALKGSVKPEARVLQILQKEMDWLKSEKRQTEAHLRRTDAWTEHLGKWKANIQSVEISDEKESLQFMILVHVDEDIHMPQQTKHATAEKEKVEARPGCISSGWVVMRSLNQVHDLQRKLRQVSTHVRSFDLPTNFKFFFLKNDRQALDKAKVQIQKFLNFILEDDHLNGSEAIYTFLSPSSDHLKQALPSPKKSKFSLSTLFKSDAAKSSDSSRANDPFWGLHRDEDDISNCLENDGGGGSGGSGASSIDFKLLGDAESKDSIAEPMYALMGEIFDMGGVFKWLRKSVISFVQITYGRTINRQIRESIASIFEESMLHQYFSAILKSFWPGGVLATAYPVRSDDMKEMTTNAAKALLMDNIPEVLCNIVGAQAAKHGVLKVFDALQNPIYNKQLFYELLEILMLELFPEIRQLKITAKQTTSNNAASAAGAVNVDSTVLNHNNHNSHQQQHAARHTSPKHQPHSIGQQRNSQHNLHAHRTAAAHVRDKRGNAH